MSFEELIKKYEPSMAVPMYPKALVIDFMKKAYEAGLHADVHTDNSQVITELKHQIEKMKCCGNCKHNKHCVDDWKGTREVIINFKSYTCKNKDKWELAE